MEKRTLFEKDLRLTKTVLEACEAVLSNDREKLTVFKRKFVVGSDDHATKSSGSAGSGGKLAQLGSAPPTSTAQDLHLVAFIKSIPSTIYHRVHEREDFKPLRQEVVTMLTPIKELTNVAKSRLAALKTKKESQVAVVEKKFGDVSAPTVL